MVQLTYTILDEKLPTVKKGLLYLHPAPAGMNENAWLREWIRRRIRDEVRRGLQAEARGQIEIELDDMLVT